VEIGTTSGFSIEIGKAFQGRVGNYILVSYFNERTLNWVHENDSGY